MYAFLALPLLFGGKCKCKKEPEGDPDLDVQTDVQDIGTRLQVAAIDPDMYDPNQAFQASVFGGGFKSGATVSIGSNEAGSVRFVDENTLEVQVPPLSDGTYDIVVQNPDGERSTLRSGLMIRAQSRGDCRFIKVYFDFDSAGLTAQSRSALDQAIPCYQSSTSAIRIEGHADERGTTDYNLALGQRRADTALRHLTGQGIAPSRIRTVSYGEERPANPGHTEAAWAENRRAELQLQ